MIVVTAATGQLGRQILEGLSKKCPTAQIGVSVRDREKAADFQQRGIRVAKGDFTDPESLTEAFDEARQLLRGAVNKFGDECVRQHANAIQAARRAGVKRIL